MAVHRPDTDVIKEWSSYHGLLAEWQVSGIVQHCPKMLLHFSHETGNLLNQRLMNRWIGRGAIPWPERSLDLTTCDFPVGIYQEQSLRSRVPRQRRIESHRERAGRTFIISDQEFLWKLCAALWTVRGSKLEATFDISWETLLKSYLVILFLSLIFLFCEICIHAYKYYNRSFRLRKSVKVCDPPCIEHGCIIMSALITVRTSTSKASQGWFVQSFKAKTAFWKIRAFHFSISFLRWAGVLGI